MVEDTVYTRVNVITNAKTCNNVEAADAGDYAIVLSGTASKRMDLQLDKKMKLYTDDPNDYK